MDCAQIFFINSIAQSSTSVSIIQFIPSIITMLQIPYDCFYVNQRPKNLSDELYKKFLGACRKLVLGMIVRTAIDYNLQYFKESSLTANRGE
jgi:hypothetical protein